MVLTLVEYSNAKDPTVFSRLKGAEPTKNGLILCIGWSHVGLDHLGVAQCSGEFRISLTKAPVQPYRLIV